MIREEPSVVERLTFSLILLSVAQQNSLYNLQTTVLPMIAHYKVMAH